MGFNLKLPSKAPDLDLKAHSVFDASNQLCGISFVPPQKTNFSDYVLLLRLTSFIRLLPSSSVSVSASSMGHLAYSREMANEFPQGIVSDFSRRNPRAEIYSRGRTDGV